MPCKALALPLDQLVPSFDQYAEAITGALLEATRTRSVAGKPLPGSILETGRAVVDDAEILGNPGGRRQALAGWSPGGHPGRRHYLLFTGFWYNHEVKPLRPLDGHAEETVLYGPLCMNIDVLRSSVMLPPLNVGDALLISSVGAYNNTQWMQFIHSACRSHGDAGRSCGSGSSRRTIGRDERLRATS